MNYNMQQNKELSSFLQTYYTNIFNNASIEDKIKCLKGESLIVNN
jgi:hypothetical protein